MNWDEDQDTLLCYRWDYYNPLDWVSWDDWDCCCNFELGRKDVGLDPEDLGILSVSWGCDCDCDLHLLLSIAVSAVTPFLLRRCGAYESWKPPIRSCGK